jgi:ABC-type transporter Mla maintaining outer membrane lipid asymmetry ATPase subunit MlaF
MLSEKISCIHTRFSKEIRNIFFIRNCDGVIFIAGSVGVANKLSLAYHRGKVIGRLINSGGIADQLYDIVRNFPKNTGAIIVSNTDPNNLVNKVIRALEKRKTIK